MSSVCNKKIWIDGKVYTILKTFDPAQLQEYCLQLIGNVYKTIFKIPMYYCKALQDNEYRNYVQKIKDNSELTISPNTHEYPTVTISSDSEYNVGQSVFHLHSFLVYIRDNIPARQFLAIPVLNPEINLNFEKFKEDLLTLKLQGVDESIFQKSAKLHLSINVFSLVDEQEIGAAEKALIDCKNEVIMPLIKKKLPLKLDVRGIEVMQGNQSKVHVLYAKAKIANENEHFSLQLLFDKINEYFYQKGFTKDSGKKPAKIHMTLMNTKYRASKIGSNRRFTKRIPINATEILSEYKDFYFGQSDLSSIGLCLISSSRHGGYYETLVEINW